MRAVSAEVKKKTVKYNNHNVQLTDDHDTKVKEVGTSRRNITRKKGGNDQFYNNKNKKQGGSG